MGARRRCSSGMGRSPLGWRPCPGALGPHLISSHLTVHMYTYLCDAQRLRPELHFGCNQALGRGVSCSVSVERAFV